jgi:hypothetical protein
MIADLQLVAVLFTEDNGMSRACITYYVLALELA